VAPETGSLLPGIQPGVAVHAIADQHGPAGQDGAVDQLLEVIHDLQARGHNPAEVPASFWKQTVHQILLCQTLSELPGTHDALCQI
jgi:hypothetical protein